MQIIPGVDLIEAYEHRDERGALVALEHQQTLPFVPERVFYMFDCPSDRQRGEHATSCHLAIVAVAGGVTVELDSGYQSGTCRLARRDHVLSIHAGVWLRLKEFAPETVLVVAASASYAQTKYYAEPQPHLLQVSAKAA